MSFVKTSSESRVNHRSEAQDFCTFRNLEAFLRLYWSKRLATFVIYSGSFDPNYIKVDILAWIYLRFPFLQKSWNLNIITYSYIWIFGNQMYTPLECLARVFSMEIKYSRWWHPSHDQYAESMIRTNHWSFDSLIHL